MPCYGRSFHRSEAARTNAPTCRHLRLDGRGGGIGATQILCPGSAPWLDPISLSAASRADGPLLALSGRGDAKSRKSAFRGKADFSPRLPTSAIYEYTP